jgi:hypothetical protein
VSVMWWILLIPIMIVVAAMIAGIMIAIYEAMFRKGPYDNEEVIPITEEHILPNIERLVNHGVEEKRAEQFVREAAKELPSPAALNREAHQAILMLEYLRDDDDDFEGGILIPISASA